MTAMPTIDAVIERAKVHGLAHERRAVGGLAIQCPECARQQVTQDVILNGAELTGQCSRCGTVGAGIVDALFRGPREIKLYSPAELLALPDPQWLVEPFLIERGLTLLFGPSNTYKTFTAIDLAARARGLAVYVSAEGSPKHIGRRIEAWEAAAGEASDLMVLPQPLNLLDKDEVAAFIAAARDLGHPIRVVVIDTLARCSPGAEENSAKDAGLIVRAIDQLRHELEAAVLVIAHTGKDAERDERGSNALPAAADIRIRMRPGTAKYEARLECARIRDSEDFEPRAVRLQPFARSLVACEIVETANVVERRVAEFLAENPGASQREVERAVTGKATAIRAAYQRCVPSQDAGDAPHRDKVRPRVPPLKGTRDTVDQDELDPEGQRLLALYGENGAGDE